MNAGPLQPKVLKPENLPNLDLASFFFNKSLIEAKIPTIDIHLTILLCESVWLLHFRSNAEVNRKMGPNKASISQDRPRQTRSEDLKVGGRGFGWPKSENS